MSNDDIVAALEAMYKTYQSNGMFEKAQEVLFKLADLKHVAESSKTKVDNILLG
jgi:lipopolysaccharide biosynthesis regulator YciM